MALILNIDTSSPICSVCLAENGGFITEKEDVSENAHATMLSIMVSETLSQSGLSLKDLSAVAISGGPGSYTGLRIGGALAKGLCYGLALPLISVPTLQGLAYRMSTTYPDPNGVYIPMIDARRNDVYTGIYDTNLTEIQADKFCTIDEDYLKILKAFKNKKIYFNNVGYLKLEKVCLNNQFGTVIENVIFKASNIIYLSYIRYVNGQYENPAYFEPFYLKEFEGRIKAK